MTAQSSGETFEFDGFHDVAVSSDFGGDELSDKSDKIGDQFMTLLTSLTRATRADVPQV